MVNISSEPRAAIKKSKCKHCKLYDFIDMKIKEDTILQPDCSIVCKPIHKRFLDFAASLVVEILSPVTALKDRHTKFSFYENFGIKYYMIVDEEKESIEVYMLTNKQYVLTPYSPAKPFTFTFTDDCKIDVLIKNIWE